MRPRALALVGSLLSLCPFASGQITPFLVEDSGGPQHYPKVNGSIVVWQEYLDGHNAVGCKDLGTGEAFYIDAPPIDRLEPDTNGSLVVWRDKRTGDFDIYAQDVQSGQQWTVVDAPFNQTQPAISQDFIVWSDLRNSTDLDIYALDLRTGLEFPVCKAFGAQQAPAVSGNIIVWEDKGRAKTYLNPLASDIYGYDVTTGKEFLIATDSKGIRQAKPAISGNIVVWIDGHNGGDIRGYDLGSATAFPIHVESPDDYAGQNDPDIDGRYVVWEDGRNLVDLDIWGYDLLTGQEFPIFRGPGNQGNPRISGNLVVWESHPPGEVERIMGAYIPEPASAGLLGLGAALLAGRRRGRPMTSRRSGREG